jgi:hypothetical protein
VCREGLQDGVEAKEQLLRVDTGAAPSVSGCAIAGCHQAGVKQETLTEQRAAQRGAIGVGAHDLKEAHAASAAVVNSQMAQISAKDVVSLAPVAAGKGRARGENAEVVVGEQSLEVTVAVDGEFGDPVV